ncbi:hypothetical protein ACQRCG_04930 [Bacillus altitudinis]|uniref:hypothetical protein n=1 Tax=Bacillus altitudinis TaxID=293387 RepID=UPI003CFDB7EE
MTQPIYKTEKRKARVGERILITNVDVNEKRYENGAVLEIEDSQELLVHDKLGRLIYDHEYEVIVGERPSAPNLDEMDYDELIALVEDAMKALRTRHLQGRFDAQMESVAKLTSEKSDQQKRDEIVEKAKEDVEYLVRRCSTARTEFIVNTEKRTVVSIRKVLSNGRVISKGIAKCAPNDCFNAHIGKAIALRRALGLPVPAEYLNVPQPTEVRVGDVVRGLCALGISTYEETVRKIAGGKYEYVSGGYDYVDRVNLVIIDDSRAGEGE